MGYANVIPYQQLTLKSGLYQSTTVTTVATNFNVATITLPTFTISPTQVYFDFYCQEIEDTSTALNYITAGETGIIAYDASDQKTGDFIAGGFLVEGSGNHQCFYCVPGSFNVYDHVRSGQNVQFHLHGVSCQGNNLKIKQSWVEARLYWM